jgi:spore coat protein CotH
MWRNIKAIMAMLLAVIILAIGISACGDGLSRKKSDQSLDPFDISHVATVRLVMSKENQAECLQNAVAEKYVKADFWFDDELVPDVAIRSKGNASLWETLKLGSYRFGLKVDFNLFNRARSFHGIKKLNLNNGWTDPTLIRECLAYEIFEQMEIPTPRASFVDLWLNDIHLGVYTMVEQIDLTFLTRHFPQTDGNLYKPRIPAAFLNWTGEDFKETPDVRRTNGKGDTETSLNVNLGGGNLGDIMQALEPKDSDKTRVPGPGGLLPGQRPPPLAPPPDMFPPLPLDYLELMQLRTNENKPDHTALLHFLDILNNEPDETFPEEIEKVLDVDETLRFLAVSTLLVHLDNYIGLGHNYYLYEMDGKFTIIPWDLNMAFGTYTCMGIEREGLINFYIDEPTGCPIAERPLVKRLLSYPPYLDAYHGYLEELLAGPFETNRMFSRIDELADVIRPFVEADTLKFYSTADFERGLVQDIIPSKKRGPKPTPEIIEYAPIGLKPFVLERSESVRQQLDGKRPSTNNGYGNPGNLWRLDFQHRIMRFFPPPR